MQHQTPNTATFGEKRNTQINDKRCIQEKVG